MEITIKVRNKIAYSPSETIVCGNSGYKVLFDFDSEWDKYEVKTARFIYGGKIVDVVFSGTICDAPKIANATMCAVGVFAGDLATTTPALITCHKSILCGGGLPTDPSPDVYSQIMDMLNSLAARVAALEKGGGNGGGNSGGNSDETNITCAVLGVAVLGEMILGG